MLTQSTGGPAPGPTLAITHVWFVIASPSWTSLKSPNSFHLTVSPMVISPLIVNTLSLQALMSSSWAASLHAQHVDTHWENWASLGTETAANAAETAAALEVASCPSPAPIPISPTSQGHQSRLTAGIPTSGEATSQSKSTS